MSWWSKKDGNTQTDTSSVVLKELQTKFSELEDKHKKLRKKYKKVTENLDIIDEVIHGYLEEQAVAKFLLFAIAVKCGGKLELCNHDIETAKKLEAEHTLDFAEGEDSVIYSIKRLEK